jgi:D-glycero-D-manno-heptose 1,7-bisphosphate phosphatase
MRRGLLLDRDGVVNVDRGYVGSRDQFEFMPGLFPFLRGAENHGFRLAILTNQSGVARGIYTSKDFENLTAWMCDALRREGITVDLVLGCLEHPEGAVAPYARESYWRKPNPGMALEAVQRLRLDPLRSVFLGDQVRDMEAAKTGGIQNRWLMNTTLRQGDGTVHVRDLDDALNRLTQLA